MSTSLSLAASQKLSISPRLQKAVRLLQLSTVDFEQEMRDTISCNPFLEELEEVNEEQQAQSDGEAALSYGEHAAFEKTYSCAGGASDLSWAPDNLCLRDLLREQLYASRQDSRLSFIAGAVIECLDEDGYLRDPVAPALASLHLQPQASDEEIKRAIALVQSFEPTGVGARNLGECLELQLRALPDDGPVHELALRIVQGHLDAIERRDFGGLQQRVGCNEEQLRAAFALLRRLDPGPGGQLRSAASDYVVPDVLVFKRGDGYQTLLNPGVRNCARLNERYVDLFRQVRRSEHPEMTRQLQEARWFLRNVEQRFDTILRVAEFIVNKQKAFFDHGDMALRPMVLREVADELGIHESTVSRATGRKYMATPRGCLEFKFFFSRELPMRQGRGCSATAVRALIHEIIDAEGQGQPLSDVEIAAQLRAEGIGIARRTVTKYRRMLKLPAAELRRYA